MADFGSMSADQINASMGLGPGGVGDQSQAFINSMYGPMGFGGQTAAYSALGAAYGRDTGGFNAGYVGADPGTDFWSGSRGSPAYTPDYGASLPGQPYYPGYFDNTFGEANSQPQQTGFSPYNSYGQSNSGANTYADPFSGGSQYTSQPWWSTFVANVGQQGAQDWINAQGGGQPQPAPEPAPQQPSQSPFGGAGSYFDPSIYAQSQPPPPSQPLVERDWNRTFNDYSANAPQAGGGNPYTSQPWWSTFVANVGPQAAQQWVNAQGGGTPPPPTPQYDPQIPSNGPYPNLGYNPGMANTFASGGGMQQYNPQQMYTDLQRTLGDIGGGGRSWQSLGMSPSDVQIFTNAVGQDAANAWLQKGAR